MSRERTTISLDGALLSRARLRMADLGIADFSGYVETLLWNDVNGGGPLPRLLSSTTVNSIHEEPTAMVAEDPPKSDPRKKAS